MGLNVIGATRFRLYGVTIKESGGDGIYLGGSDGAFANSVGVHVKDVTSDGNNRQGLSVCGARDVLVERPIIPHFLEVPRELGLRPLAQADLVVKLRLDPPALHRSEVTPRESVEVRVLCIDCPTESANASAKL